MNFKKGDLVTSLIHGDGEVECIMNFEGGSYSLKCVFNKETLKERYYTTDGFYEKNHVIPTLYPRGTTFEIKEPPFNHPSIGDKFTQDDGTDVYILVAFKNTVFLSNSRTGGYWSDGCVITEYENKRKVTKEQWEQISGGCNFKPVKPSKEL